MKNILDEKREVLKTALVLWGMEAQIGMFHEEVGELMQAINKHKRKPNEETKDHLAEELADVKILLAQLEEIIDKDRLEFWLTFKLDRLSRRIKKTVKEREESYERAKGQAGISQNLFNALSSLGVIALGEEMKMVREAIKRDDEEL